MHDHKHTSRKRDRAPGDKKEHKSKKGLRYKEETDDHKRKKHKRKPDEDDEDEWIEKNIDGIVSSFVFYL